MSTPHIPTRAHTAPDGTPLTLIRRGEQAFLCSYPEDTFFEGQIFGTASMTGTDIDAIGGGLLCRNIGK